MAVSRYYSSIAVDTTLTADITNSATTMRVASMSGFPSNYPYTLILAEDEATEEIVEVTAYSAPNLTITRGINGTTGRAHTSGTTVHHGVSARDFTESREHEDDSTNVHGIADTAALVTLTGTQTLTNKTIDGDSNTFQDIPASAVKARPINAQTGTSYTLALADAKKVVTLDNASAVAVTLPAQATVTWLSDSAIGLVNLGAGTATVAGDGFTINGDDLTLATGEGGTLLREGSNEWWFLKGGGGGAIPFGSASGGTPTTYSASGTDYAVNSFTDTAGGTLVVAEPGGLFDFLVVGGGGSGPSASAGANGVGGGGGGGVKEFLNVYLPAGSYPVVVGAGGVAAAPIGTNGGASSVAHLIVPGGGAGGGNGVNKGQAGACGGGTSRTSVPDGGQAIAGFGYIGGAGSDTGTYYGGGGGGGMGAVGQAGNGSGGGNGGAGITSSLRTGSAVTYGGGGGGACYAAGVAGAGGSGGGGAGGVNAANGTAGTANTGGGGGGAGSNGGAGGTGGNGGSGLVVIRSVVATSVASGIIISGGTETDYTGDGTNGVNGQDYRVHAITADTTMTVTAFPADATCDLLVVGGGGGGASTRSGGGGGGGVLAVTGAVLPVGSLPVKVGAGGLKFVPGVYFGTAGRTGEASIVGPYIAPGGGGAGGASYQTGTSYHYGLPGNNGGSGGGGGGFTSGSNPGAGAGTTGLGNNGGSGFASSGSAGGGGGAGAVGGAATSTVGGAGGAGVTSYITGSAVVYGGGGGGHGTSTGGAGGSGGGGAGAASGPGTDGTANRGGGGGGCDGSSSVTPGSGGSGVVYIRYTI